jgi:nucleotide-binding universal stress UspA family protein
VRLKLQDATKEAVMAARAIVVGTDGSEQSLRAVDWAARDAALRDVPLRIVSVAPLSQGLDLFTRPAPYSAAVRETAERALDDAFAVASMTTPGLTIDTALRTGEPGPVLARAAERAALLVVGSGGHGNRFAGMALASVSRYLAAHAPCPVVIDRGELTNRGHQVVVGIRDFHDSEAQLAFAFEEASNRGAHLVAVRAWYWLPPAGAAATIIAPSQASADALTRLYRLLEPWQHKYPDVELGEEIIHAHPGQALLDLTTSASLLVLGRCPGGHAGIDPPIGPVTYAVLKDAHCPVAIVPAAE